VEKNCTVGVLADASVVASCPSLGAPVPGCKEGTRFGLEQAFYTLAQAYRRPLNGEWSAVDVLSDPEKRAGAPQFARASTNQFLLTDRHGDAFLLWNSDVPCQPSGGEIFASVSTPENPMWTRKTIFASGEPKAPMLDDASVDGRGIVHTVWRTVDLPGGAPHMTLFTEEVFARPLAVGDLNRDGVIDCADMAVLRLSLQTKSGDPGFNARADFNGDGFLDPVDVQLLQAKLPLGTKCGTRL